MASHFLRTRVSSAKTMLHSTPFSQEARKNTSPLSGKNALLFPLRPPLSDRHRAPHCGERTSRMCTHPRASVGFRFLPSPFTTGPQQPDSSSVGGEDAAHFRPSPPLPTYAARVKDGKQKPSPLMHWRSTRWRRWVKRWRQKTKSVWRAHA